MMAALGAVIQPLISFPGFDKVPKGLSALTTSPGKEGFAVLFLVSGVLELVLWNYFPFRDVESIGDYGNPMQLGIGQSVKESQDMRDREINNGRAAMFAITGIIVAELATG